MIEEAITYPRNSDDALRTILIGGVLGILGFLVIPTILVFGYLMRVLRRSMDGLDEPPVFDEWGALLLDGVKGALVVFAYSLLPLIVLTVTVGGAAASAILTGDVSAGAIAGSVLGVLVAGVLWLAAWYVLPAALANTVREDTLRGAFAFGELRPILFDGEYATGWLVALAIVIVGGIVVGVLNAIPVLGFIAGAFVMFYASMSAFYVYGRAFDAAQSRDGPAESRVGQPTA